MSDFDHKTFLTTLTTRPGVYQMYDSDGGLLYVGKAKNLKNRVGSYFRAGGLTDKTILSASGYSGHGVAILRLTPYCWNII